MKDIPAEETSRKRKTGSEEAFLVKDDPIALANAIEKVLYIKVESYASVESFICEFEDILRVVKENGVEVELSGLQSFLWGCLIRATGTSKEFETEHNWIIDHPNETMQKYLSRLRMRDSINKLVNGVPPVSDDTAVATSNLRRDGTGGVARPAKKQKTEGETKRTPWNIPRFPNSWRNMMSKAAFKSLVAWRKYYHGTTKPPNSFQLRLPNSSSRSTSNRKASGGRTRR